MKIPSKHIENAVDQMASLPGIGRRTALRLVLQLMTRSNEEIAAFSDSFIEMKENIKQCKTCGNVSDKEICSICANPNRNHRLICIVEDIRDVLAIESTETYKGVYHVLGGIISPMDGIGPSDLAIPELIDRVENGDVSEVVFALSATMEGDTTNFFIYKKLKDSDVIISSIARGVAVGSELQYADEVTLSRSLINRQPFSR
ncbi:MAG: recombination mediator RecR [Crocinitomicaceae bacterium]|nr:recombination mediator RecR [Crocinitomicaceae bacterium]MDG1657814.1 recombination mediator RecR [Crocinitomicaceae bacterium]